MTDPHCKPPADTNRTKEPESGGINPEDLRQSRRALPPINNLRVSKLFQAHDQRRIPPQTT